MMIQNEPVVGGPVYSCSVSSRYPNNAELHRYEYTCARVGTVSNVKGNCVRVHCDPTGTVMALHKNSSCRTYPVDGSCELPGIYTFTHHTFSEEYARVLCQEALRQLRDRAFQRFDHVAERVKKM